MSPRHLDLSRPPGATRLWTAAVAPAVSLDNETEPLVGECSAGKMVVASPLFLSPGAFGPPTSCGHLQAVFGTSSHNDMRIGNAAAIARVQRRCNAGRCGWFTALGRRRTIVING